MKLELDGLSDSDWRASLPRNGERGLKQDAVAAFDRLNKGIAPQKRGAWIETSACGSMRTASSGIAPQKRGAWIETRLSRNLPHDNQGIAPQKRGAWIETMLAFVAVRASEASLPRNGERGLKHCLQVVRALRVRGIAPQKRGAWIETDSARRRSSRTHQRIAPQKRGAWIETFPFRWRRNPSTGIAPQKRGAWIETVTYHLSTSFR